MIDILGLVEAMAFCAIIVTAVAIIVELFRHPKK